MLNYDNFAITLGRAIESFRTRPDAVAEHKTVLRALVALTRLGGVTLISREGGLVVEGRPVASTLPGIRTLLAQMDAHNIREIGIAERAAPADLLKFLREMAGGLVDFADGSTLGDRLRASAVTSVIVRIGAAPEPAPGQRPPGVSEAFASEDVARALAEATAASRPGPLAAVIADLALDPSRADVLDRATSAADLVQRELEAGRVSSALSSAAELVRLEARLPESGARRSFAIVLNRLLSRPLLQTAAAHSRDPARAPSARLLLTRGGGDATEVLLERLVQGQTMGERRHYFDLLRTGGTEGLRQVILMLGHPEWFAVRNVAELLGELRVAEAVAPLARTLRHPDPRVRRAAALALARIGTPDTLEHLGALLGDEDPDLRLAVAGVLGGREMQTLEMPLVRAAEAERDPRVALELYRALGRLGSGAALQALARGVAPVGWHFWRRRPGRRLAAIEGLKLAGSPVAIGTLESLVDDRDYEVRRAAREALEDLDVL